MWAYMKNSKGTQIISLYFLPFMCIVILGAGTLMYSPMHIPYTKALGGLEVHGTYIEGASKFIACLGVVYVANLSMSWGRKKTLFIIFCMGSVGSLIAALAPNPLVLLLASSISSLSFASMSAVMMVYLAEIAPSNRQGTALGVFGSGIGISAALGAVSSTILAEKYGFRVPFMGSAILIAIGALMVKLFFSDKTDQAAVVMNAQCRGASALRLLKNVTKITAMGIVLYYSAFAYQFSQSSLSTLLSPFVVYLNFPLRVAGLGIGAFGIFGLMQPLGGRFGDTFGRTLGITLGTVLFFTGLLLLSSADSIPMVLLGTGLFGIGTSLFMPSICVAIYNSVPKEYKGITMGLFQSILTVGAVLGPVSGGVALHFWGPRFPFVLNSIVVGVSLFLLLAFAGSGKYRKKGKEG